MKLLGLPSTQSNIERCLVERTGKRGLVLKREGEKVEASPAYLFLDCKGLDIGCDWNCTEKVVKDNFRCSPW